MTRKKNVDENDAALHDRGEFDAAYWEARYRTGGGASRRDPSPSLLAEATELSPGAALDAGCGWGADALWLAARGWTVTAVDVSATAVDQAKKASEAANPSAAGRISWLAADLTTWEPEGHFDLVTSHYVHVPGPPEELVARLASWVAPGGTLLIVGHAPGKYAATSPPETARVRLAQITSALPEPAWEVMVAEPRTHSVNRPDGGPPVVLDDVIVKAQRVHLNLRG